MKLLKILSIGSVIAGAALSLLDNYVAGKELDEKIDEKLNERLLENHSENEEES